MITALDYTFDDDIIVPETPDSRAEGEEEEAKAFRIEQLPNVIIKRVSEFWTVDEIQKLKHDCHSRVLKRLLTIYVQHHTISITNQAAIFHYFAPTNKSKWLWKKAHQLIYSAKSKPEFIECPYLSLRNAPILRCDKDSLEDALSLVRFSSLKELYVRGGTIADVFEILTIFVGIPYINMLSLESSTISSYGTQLPLTLQKELPNLKVLKLPNTTKFFLQEQKNLARYCPKLERVEEARTTWEKVDGKWFAETEATEVKVQLSTKRKRLPLEEVKHRPGEVFRCNNCNGSKHTQNSYMAPEVALCGHCFTGTRNLVELQNQIDTFKKQRTCTKCEKETICKCERVLALDDFMLTDYPVQ